MSSLRWGILGNAKHAVDAILPALAKTETGKAVAIAARNADAAAATAKRFGVDRVHKDYDALLADPDVDAIYIGLPNSLHAKWISRSIAAGKHVLCEKPITVTAAETDGIAEAATARGIHVQEALMTWSHPRWHRIRDVIRSGKIGRPTAVQGRFSFFTRDAGNIRNQSSLGGGALLDLGMYLVSSARFVLETEPTRTAALVEYDPDFGTDRYCSFLLDFPNAQGSFVCSNQMGYAQRMIIYGTHGHIDIDTPWTPSPTEPTRFILSGADGDTAPLVEEVVTVPIVDQYTEQMAAFAELVAGKRPPAVPFASSVKNMRVLDAIRAAGKSGTWQEI
jgi:predicted dehydrogenase